MSFLRKKSFKIILITAILLAVIFIGCAIYLSDYYKADVDEIEAFLPKMTTEAYKNGYISFGSEGSAVGFIFYPGGKVEYTAYVPLMRAIADGGVFCVLFEMPFNLAVLDSNAADGIREEYPEVAKWFIGGHSLGGSMAASYLKSDAEDFEGLVLLGSYSTVDLSHTSLSVLSVYGSEDGVMNREKYEKNKANLPTNFKEVVIDGGCHAYFGMYGEQDGDGIASISSREQIIITAEEILNFAR